MVFIPQRVEARVAASAPANMILMGEYAVLEGACAVMMTLPRRLTVHIAPAPVFCVVSDIFGRYTAGQGTPPAHVVLIRNVLDVFAETTGQRVLPEMEIDIQSDIPATYGFGSSAALVAALVKALAQLCGMAADFQVLFAVGRGAILKTHGRGSGADLAAALADAPFVVFDPVEISVRAFFMPYCVQAVYTGYKTPTPDVIRHVEATVPPDVRGAILDGMKVCVADFVRAPSYALVREYQGLMEKLGVACAACRAAAGALAAAGAVAKISGSGMGDCVVGFADAPVQAEVQSPFVFIPEEELCRATNR